jgi:hypothetical protein
LLQVVTLLTVLTLFWLFRILVWWRLILSGRLILYGILLTVRESEWLLLFNKDYFMLLVFSKLVTEINYLLHLILDLFC